MSALVPQAGTAPAPGAAPEPSAAVELGGGPVARTSVPLVPGSVGVLEPFVLAGVFDPAEVQLAASVARLSPGLPDEVLLALAVAARGPRRGHVCVELADVARLVVGDVDDRTVDLPWPDPADWAAALESSPVVGAPADHLDEPHRPLVWDGRRLYLHRFFHHETVVAHELRARALRGGGTTVDAGDTSADASSPLGVAGGAPGAGEASEIEHVLDRLFGPDPTMVDPAAGDGAGPPAAGAAEPDLQRLAARTALEHGLAVIVGGPGTGKTRTVARLLAAAQLRAAAQGRQLDVALAAPTGKAAARMTEAVRAATDELAAEGDPELVPVLDLLRATDATTVHRLLGWAPGTRFRHDRSHPLPHDLVVVDETSMVALPLMARLLDAVRPDAQLVLVGDPYQLASVEAGTVLADVVGPALGTTTSGGRAAEAETSAGSASAAETSQGSVSGPLAGHVAVLRRSRRFDAGSGIAALAEAVRLGDADAALAVLDDDVADTRWVRPDDAAALAELEHQVVDAGVEVAMAALAGFASSGLQAALAVKVLAATRHRRGGLYDWNERIESAIAARVPDLAIGRRWYVGRPVIVTANDPLTRVANGDVGLVVAQGDGLAVAFPTGDDVRLVPPSRLDRVETWWAMTIHKSQGSEFDHAVVSLPESDSPILTRELLYTGVTRARSRVTVVGTEESLRAAIDRPIARASGLRARLWPDGGV
jgi:exodeoxyribonuclease V alpha subunit